MFGVLALLGKLLTLIPGVTTAVTGYLEKRADVQATMNGQNVSGDVAVNQAGYAAYVEGLKLAAASRQADRASWLTAWMLPAAFTPFMIHAGAVAFDCIPLFGHVVGSWRIAALPGDYFALQQSIIASVAGVVITKTVVGAASKVFTKN